jgi:SAM-dependent methyltransferase
MAWYRQWFGDEYLDLYSHRDSGEAEMHVRFVLERLGPQAPRAVLDLACGAGRHTAALRQHGLRALGVDLSVTLLLRGVGLPRVAADMRGLPFASGTFDWVLNFFTSFGYFETERENFQVLEEVVRVLAPGGRLVLDFMNIDRALAELEPSETVASGGRVVAIERWYDQATQRLNKRIRVGALGASPARTFLESVRAYRAEEVATGLRWAGLEVTGLYGNFQGDPYRLDSERVILVGKKPAL